MSQIKEVIEKLEDGKLKGNISYKIYSDRENSGPCFIVKQENFNQALSILRPLAEEPKCKVCGKAKHPDCNACGNTGKPCPSCGEYHRPPVMCPPHEVRMRQAKDICPVCERGPDCKAEEPPQGEFTKKVRLNVGNWENNIQKGDVRVRTIIEWLKESCSIIDHQAAELKTKDELLEWAWVDCGSQGDLTGYLEHLEEMNKPSET